MINLRDIHVEGVRCAVYDSGPAGNREAVVCVHGNPGPMDDWEWLLPALRPFARAIAMDLPGFGRAEHPRDFDFSVPGYTRYLAGLIDRLEVQRVHLVLHDFGGAFGLAWAAAHPERCASVTLINTGVLQNYRWHTMARIWQTPVLGELFQLSTTPARMQSTLDRMNPRPLPAGYVERVLRHADWAHRRAVLKLYRASRDPEQHFAGFVPQLSRLDIPVCVAWGDGDPFLPVAFAPRQREVFARAEVHVLPGMGHWPFLDDPAAVRAVVVPFLQRQFQQPAAAVAR